MIRVRFWILIVAVAVVVILAIVLVQFLLATPTGYRH